MKFFIFRNNTLENIFGTDEVEYSGYEDISYTSKYIFVFVDVSNTHKMESEATG